MTLKEIEEYKESVLQIIFDVQVSVYNAKFIGTETSENEDWVKRHSFFKHYFFQLRFISIIQLAKLFTDSKNERQNFHNFIRKIESSKHPVSDDQNRNKITNQNQKEILVTELKNMLYENKSDIDILINLRNNVYAHGKKIKQDGKESDKTNIQELSWPKIEKLSEMALDFYNKINSAFFDGEFFFPNKSSWSPEWVVKTAATTRKDRFRKKP